MGKRPMSKTERNRLALIYVRYLLPAITLVLTILSSFVPCLHYTGLFGDFGHKSFATWIGERWVTTRDNLSNMESAEANLVLSAEFFLLICFGLLFLVGAAVTVYTVVKATDVLREPTRFENDRVRFITLVPNRIVFCLYRLLLLPFLLMPRIWLLLLEIGMQFQQISLSFSPFEPWLIATVLLVTEVVLSLVCRRWEVGEKNPFLRRKLPKEREETEDVLSQKDAENGTPDGEVEDSRAAYIRRLLQEDMDTTDDNEST